MLEYFSLVYSEPTDPSALLALECNACWVYIAAPMGFVWQLRCLRSLATTCWCVARKPLGEVRLESLEPRPRFQAAGVCHVCRL